MTAPAAPPAVVDIAGAGALEVSFLPADPGSGRLPPLVFLHEGLGSVGLWRQFPSAVRGATGHPALLVYSRRGYGASAPAQLPRPADYMHREADDGLVRVLDHFGVEAPFLVGHSDGASIALLYAGGGHDVAGLALLAPHVFVEDVSVEAIQGARQDYDTGGLRAALARHHADVDNAFRGWNDVWLSGEFRAWNIKDCLAAITCPVLLVQGDGDPYGTIAQLDAIEAGVAGPVERVLLDGVGHAPHLEAGDATLAAVASFVVRTRPSTRSEQSL